MGVATEAAPVVGRGREQGEDAGAPGPVAIDLAFEDAFERSYRRASGVGYQLLRRRREAEDVAQEALARAFVHWRKVREAEVAATLGCSVGVVKVHTSRGLAALRTTTRTPEDR